MDEVRHDSPSSIEIIPLETHEHIQEASDVLAHVWEGGDGAGVPQGMLRALAHSGNYTYGVFDGPRMVAASVAFFAKPGDRSMHSHITGVLPGYQGRGLGRLLKHHQRQWAFDRDVGRITWTFDPLVARNAHFNLRNLGARVTDYLVDFYGTLDDGLNGPDATDRLMVTWSLAAPADTPDPADVVATVEVPRDIVAVRQVSPADASAWRLRVREAFDEHIANGLKVGGFDDELGYLFVR
jgi:predicted GNAT superfamily acetyltransferase